MPLTQRRWTRGLPGERACAPVTGRSRRCRRLPRPPASGYPKAGGSIRVMVRDLVSPVPRRDVRAAPDASDRRRSCTPWSTPRTPRPPPRDRLVDAALARSAPSGRDRARSGHGHDRGRGRAGDRRSTAGPGRRAAEQRRETFCWLHAERGHLGIAGGPRSGRSTALVTLAVGLAELAAAQDVHVHVLQGAPGPCAALAQLPHVGTVTDSGNPALSRRLVLRLLRLVDGDEVGPAGTVVLVDGWESLEESLSGIDHGAPVDDLHRLLRDGPAAGVRFAVTGGRAILSGRLPGVAGTATGAAHAGPAGSHPRRGRAVARGHSPSPGTGDRPPNRPRAAAGPSGRR